MLSGICQIQIAARDLPRLAEFYREVLGFPQLNQPEGVSPDYWVCLQTGPVELALVAAPCASNAAEKSSSAIHIAFRVADMEAVREVLAARGLPLGEVRAAMPGIQVCECRDPEGNRLILEARD